MPWSSRAGQESKAILTKRKHWRRLEKFHSTLQFSCLIYHAFKILFGNFFNELKYNKVRTYECTIFLEKLKFLIMTWMKQSLEISYIITYDTIWKIIPMNLSTILFYALSCVQIYFIIQNKQYRKCSYPNALTSICLKYTLPWNSSWEPSIIAFLSTGHSSVT